MELPYNPSNPLQDTYPEEVQSFNYLQEKPELSCSCNTIYIRQSVGLMDEWAVPVWCIYAQWNIVHPSKDRVTCSNRDRTGDTKLKEISQTHSHSIVSV